MNKKSNVFAIVGFILSILSVGVLGIIFSIIGISEAKKNDGYLKGLSIAGLIIGILKILLWVFIIFLTIFVFMKETDTDGKCRLAVKCVPGLFGNYECKYYGESLPSTITCSREQIKDSQILDQGNVVTNTTTSKSKDNKDAIEIVVFYGNGCPHCEHLFQYLNNLSNDSEYGKMFKVTKYEVWYNEDNKEKLYKAQDHFDLDNAGSVPFFIIGDNYYVGFGNPETMPDSKDIEYKNAIRTAYEEGYTDINSYIK